MPNTDQHLRHFNLVLTALICAAMLYVRAMPYSFLLHVDDQGFVVDETIDIIGFLVSRFGRF